MMANIAGNLALCYYRLGEIAELTRWSEESFERGRMLPRGHYVRVRALYYIGLASVFSRSRSPASDLVSKLAKESDFSSIPWIVASSALYQADILWLQGKRKKALTQVSRLFEVYDVSEDIGRVGAYARWSAVLGVNGGNPIVQLNRVTKTLDRLESLDKMDRIELRLAVSALRQVVGALDEGLGDHAKKELAELPLACTLQLTTLGLLRADGGPQAFPKTLL